MNDIQFSSISREHIGPFFKRILWVILVTLFVFLRIEQRFTSWVASATSLMANFTMQASLYLGMNVRKFSHLKKWLDKL